MAEEDAAARRQRVEELARAAILADAAARRSQSQTQGVLAYLAPPKTEQKRARVNRLFLSATVAAVNSANRRAQAPKAEVVASVAEATAAEPAPAPDEEARDAKLKRREERRAEKRARKEARH